MPFVFSFFLLWTSAVTTAAPRPKIIPKVIYGQDDRLDVFESQDELLKRAARSTAVMVMDGSLFPEGDVVTLKGKTLADYQMCPSERFLGQLAVGKCSGFLVGRDLLATAGHCINSVRDCERVSWIFDYANTEGEQSSFAFSKDQVFRCTKVIERQKDPVTQVDYALLKLDRAVPHRDPLPIRRKGRPADDAVMAVIGYPRGLPAKITSVADMRRNDHPSFFVINSDTFIGNSGSAVLDVRTGVVEGIMVRGDTDFVWTEASCYESNHNSEEGGRGEDITRITLIKALQKR